MTAHDSDTALDALLARADDAVLTAVEDALDLERGRRALALLGDAELKTARDVAAATSIAYRGPAGLLLPLDCSENALLRELLGVLDEAGRAASMLRSALELHEHATLLRSVGALLQGLADNARLRKADGPTAVRALAGIRRSVALTRSSITELDGESADSLAGRFEMFDDLLVRAQALVVRLFADHGELSCLPGPAR